MAWDTGGGGDSERMDSGMGCWDPQRTDCGLECWKVFQESGPWFGVLGSPQRKDCGTGVFQPST